TTAMWRTKLVALVFSTVLNATRVPSGEIAGKIPSAIFFAPVPSRLAIQTASLRSKAISCAAGAPETNKMKRKIRPMIFFMASRVLQKTWLQARREKQQNKKNNQE